MTIALFLITKIGELLDKRGSSRVITRSIIKDDGTKTEESPYMKRHYLLRTPWFTVFLHNFYISDRDDPHDHPWDNISIPLYPGFFETCFGDKWESYGSYPGVTKWRRPLGVYFRKARATHIVKVKPGYEGCTWSLFIHFKRERVWGFRRYMPSVPQVTLRPNESAILVDKDQINDAYNYGCEIDVDGDVVIVRNTTKYAVKLGGRPAMWQWFNFKKYGEVFLNHNIQSSTSKGTDRPDDFHLVGWLLPKVVSGPEPNY